MTQDKRLPLGDVDAGEMRAHLHQVADWIADYREGIATRRIVPEVNPGDITATLAPMMPEQGEPIEDILADFDSQVMPGVVHWGHPAFLGYFGSTSNGPALLGEMLAAALNVSAMTWKTSPAATELETLVLTWIRDLIGLPPALFGIVYDTASVAVLHALAAAREGATHGVRSHGMAGRHDVPRLRVYASDQAHSSVDKAMVMLGLGEENVVRVACDAAFAMDVAALRRAIEMDVARGYRAMAVVATVGTTSTASVDPVAAIAEVCGVHGAWLHVDAAYGGAMGALPESGWITNGFEHADSIVVNPHKWLLVPLDFSALYVRKPELLRGVFANTAEYLRGDANVVGEGADVINYMDYGIQLGRRFRALKAWMVLRAFGRDGMASRIREHCRLAALFASWVEASPGFEVVAPVVMAVVCFRVATPGVALRSLDEFNERIVERVNASGNAYLTHTRLNGRTCMRMGVGNITTTEAHLAHVWSCIQREVRGLDGTATA
ncbi:MAG: pyridoxal-dependent decarboxylase [Gemmatimonadota bacterium]|nr:pyridoxal-dependent decarboxylase [Gemmatimonadota bacterium]